MSPENKKAQSFLAGLGIEVSAVGTPFWKPDGRKRTVTVTAIRAPSENERVKPLPNGGDLEIYAVLDVEAEGIPHRWEVSSKRALAALDAAVNALPVDLDIQQHGKGHATTYTVGPAAPKANLAKGKLSEATPATSAEPCDAPGCTGFKGHAGRHKVA